MLKIVVTGTLLEKVMMAISKYNDNVSNFRLHRYVSLFFCLKPVVVTTVCTQFLRQRYRVRPAACSVPDQD